MRLHIELDGQVSEVTIVAGANAGTLDLHLDGRALSCDVRDLGHGRLSLRLPDGAMLDMVVEGGAQPGERLVHVDGRRLPALASTRARRSAGSGAAAGGPLRLVAPMPGKVLRVPVAVGDLVEARQPLVVIEAMKMENALSAGRAGMVREVLVRAGESVEAGRPLVVVE
ncbi:acetyl-CoA carboxylase biotin carboxyl carrier protein subunit [Luteitalea sp. TBR-22]|uniref:acetyl-CoA carboxylase biotin carboxyl carrier protein subunit n=1 Tax=Luteitalea sp. TBR-22 TaxID=2802971 RepID=UPI001EF478C4|nr:acetyl-CoA carboxylase biotin carboxyl carrier protein subunit [Luteitalea sp. TBR-22]